MMPALRVALLCLAGLCAGPVRADTPLPPPVAGETLLAMDQRITGQIAPPVALPDGSVRLFNADGDQVQMWSVYPLAPARNSVKVLPGFRVPYGRRQGYSESAPARYASVRTAAGIWLIGPDVRLVRDDGSVVTGALVKSRFEPQVVAASDGSVVVVGGESWPEPRRFAVSVAAERVRPDPQGRPVSTPLPPVPVDISGTGVWESLYGFSLLALPKGQILLAGSQYRNLTLLYEPGANAWQKLPGMAIRRDAPGLVLLGDGRVWAAGGADSPDAASTSELWSPSARVWTPGPVLPAPMRGHRVLWSPERGEALLAGGYLPVVLAWKPGDPHVRIVARHGLPRSGGGVVMLGKDRIALVSGLYARMYEEAYGRRAPGASIVSLESHGEATAAALWPLLDQGAMTVRGDRLLTAGGRYTHAYRGSEDMVAGRSVELQDLRSGRVIRGTLPVEAVSAQAAWLDDGHVLINAERSGDGLLQWLGMLDAGSGALRPISVPPESTYAMSDGVHRRMRLIGTNAGAGWLVGESSDVYRVDGVSGRLTAMPRLPRQRAGFTGRVLADGRLIVAGGEVESEWVAARQEHCADCPVTYQGYGPRLPSRRYDIFDPAAGTWQSSAPSRMAGSRAVVLPSGRVVKLGMPPLREGAAANPEQGGVLEVSDPAGQGWTNLSAPAGIVLPGDPEQVALLGMADGSDRLRDAVFLGVPGAEDGVRQWYWLENAGATPQAWRSLGESVLPDRFPPGEIPTGLKTEGGQSIRLIGGPAGVAVVLRPD